MTPTGHPSTVTTDLLPADTSMNAVTLYVADLPAMTAWYRDAIALSVLSDAGGTTVLGRGHTPLLVLRRAPDLPVPGRGQAGLFHTAILYDDRAVLAAASRPPSASRLRRTSARPTTW